MTDADDDHHAPWRERLLDWLLPWRVAQRDYQAAAVEMRAALDDLEATRQILEGMVGGLIARQAAEAQVGRAAQRWARVAEVSREDIVRALLGDADDEDEDPS